MKARNPLHDHQRLTRKLAAGLAKNEIYHWLIRSGYFPESYVLPPCFTVAKHPKTPRMFFRVKPSGKYPVPPCECVNVHFPKTSLTDRTFGLIDPRIHNDIAYHIARNWSKVLRAMCPRNSKVSTYSFPIAIDARSPGRLGHLRSGRMIYEFLTMVDDDIAAMAFRYSHLVKTDIKNFYPSIYTHSIAWALHGKRKARKNRRDYKLLGNRLDKLFQMANDGCTNGVPIGPVVSDVIAEVVASAVDVILTESLSAQKIDCEVVRFKDDYRILVKSETDGPIVIKHLQLALKKYNLELSDDKTSISKLPDGLFREWVSLYHAVHPRSRNKFTWKQFRELYLAVLRIEKKCPGTGMIDRFVADIISNTGQLKVSLSDDRLQKVLSMLFMLATLHIKAFPKVLAIVESVLKSPVGHKHRDEIVEYLSSLLLDLSKDEERNKYLITWISYFIVSNRLTRPVLKTPKLKDMITRSVFNNRGTIFKYCKDFKLFVGCVRTGKKMSMLKHLEIFSHPAATS
jgi:hypothetical protein